MSKLLELSAIGARETMLAQAMNSHNLANASTPGFRKDLAVYAGTRSSDGLKSGVDLSPGTVQSTGNKLDVAIDDSTAGSEGYFVIEAPDGTDARPIISFSIKTSTSIVGFPLESNISLEIIFFM